MCYMRGIPHILSVLRLFVLTYQLLCCRFFHFRRIRLNFLLCLLVGFAPTLPRPHPYSYSALNLQR